jgi:hypothetical protein
MKHSITRITAQRRVAAALPPEIARRLLAGLRSPKPHRKQQAIEACLAARAFAAGFARGADTDGARRRHVVGSHHQDWLRGYDAGQRAADQAAARYLADQPLPPCVPRDARAPPSSARDSGATAPPARPERAHASHATRPQPSPQLNPL